MGFKKISLIFAVAFLSGNLAFANADLKQSMKEIGGLFKKITKTMTDSASNKINADNAKQVSDLFMHAELLTPDSITAMPKDQQAAAKEDYKKMIEECAMLSHQLSEAFSSNLSQDVLNGLVQQLLKLRKEGHDKYDI